MALSLFNLHRDTRSLYSILLIGFAVTVFLQFRNAGLYPYVFLDEYLYSKLSRLQPLADATVPSYLYLVLFKATNLCGDGFLSCARLLNTGPFACQLRSIFLTARRVTSRSLRWLSWPNPFRSSQYLYPILHAGGCVLPFLLDFCVLRSWHRANCELLSMAGRWGPAWRGFAHQTTRSISDPGDNRFRNLSRSKSKKRMAVADVASLMIGIAAIKFGVGFLLAGSAGITFFGPLYYSSVATPESVIDVGVRSGGVIWGHLLAICLIYGVAAASTIYRAASSIVRGLTFSGGNVAVLALLIIASMVLVTGVVTGKWGRA